MITKSIWINAQLATVHAFFTDSDKMSAWCGLAVRLDPRAGGIYELDMGEAGVISGAFVSVEDTRIVQEVQTETGEPASRIEITLTEEAGGTRVDVAHSGIEAPFDKIAMRGWDHHLARLSVVATGGSAGPDGLCHRPMDTLI